MAKAKTGKHSLTIQRNKQIVGHNNKSYNDKHPHNPTTLRPIHDAIRKDAEVAFENTKNSTQKEREDVFAQFQRTAATLRRIGFTAPRQFLQTIFRNA